MDLTDIQVALGLATSAVGLTGKAASTIAAIKGLFESENDSDAGEAAKLLNSLASDLTAANVMNVQLSEALRNLSKLLQREDQFEREKARYELFETAESDFVFKLRDDMANGQPIHFICPVCLNSKETVSFIAGQGSYKHCQADKNHLFKFKDTAVRRRPPSGSMAW